MNFTLLPSASVLIHSSSRIFASLQVRSVSCGHHSTETVSASCFHRRIFPPPRRQKKQMRLRFALYSLGHHRWRGNEIHFVGARRFRHTRLVHLLLDSRKRSSAAIFFCFPFRHAPTMTSRPK